MTELEEYEAALDAVRSQVSILRDDDLARSTPCADWDVVALLGHTLGAIEYYAMLGRGEDVPRREVTVPVEPGDDFVAVFDEVARGGRDAWSAPGALNADVRMILGPMPGRDALAIHIGDLAVHAWDLGTALGNEVELPAALAMSALATWRRVLAGRDLRGIVFDGEIVIDASADPTAQLLAFCGRQP